MAILKNLDPLRLFMRRVGILFLAVFSLAALSGVWDVYHKERESRTLRGQAEMRLKDLADRDARLRSEIAALKTERGQEEALREQYEVGRAGENLVIIVEPPQPLPIVATTTFRTWLQKFLPFW